MEAQRNCFSAIRDGDRIAVGALPAFSFDLLQPFA